MAHLVELAKQKDVDAFSLLYEMVYQDMYKMALYTLGNPHDAEDVVSEAVLDAYQGISSLRDKTAFRGWIFRILSCKCKQRIKYYQHERNKCEKEIAEEIPSPQAEKDMENLLDRQNIAAAFAQISAEERLIVTMVIYGGYDSREISGILHKNRNTIRSKYRRTLKKLQKILS